MNRAVELAGWVLAVGGLAAAGLARYRMASLAETVARTCHELRGPLTAVRLGLIVAFRSGALADARLRAIELELGRATLALEDLSAAWERREARLIAERVDVAQLLAESVEAWQGAARSHGAGLRLHESDTRPTVLGERLRLAQAIGNVIANAVEHGGGTTEVSWRSEASMVRIEVRDQGAGLPAPVPELARRPRVAWPGRGRHRVGSRRGHGLAIASAIAAAHGGRLCAAPSERGARLVLELPSAPDDAVGSLGTG